MPPILVKEKPQAPTVTDEIVYLTELLGLKVYDLKGRMIGTLRDAALVPLVDPVRVDRFLVGAGQTWLSIRYDQVQSITRTGIHLRDETMTPYHSDEYMLRMARDLLDQQIIDGHGRKVVRVNDVTLTRGNSNGAEILNILEIDIGLRSMLRRVLSGIVPSEVIRVIQERIPPHSIPWEFCNMLEPDPKRRVRLNMTNKLLVDMHPADLADIVEHLGHEDRAAIFDSVDAETAAELLSEVDPDMQATIIESMETEKAADILEEMDPSEAADVLNELEDEQSEQILEEMEPDDKEEVEELLDFGEHTAGGLMDTGFFALSDKATVEDAMAGLKNADLVLEDLYSVFLVSPDKSLLGSVPLAKLFFAAGDTPLSELAAEPFLSVMTDEKQDRVAEIFDKYNLLALPVVDEQNELVGVIKVDDVVTLLRQR